MNALTIIQEKYISPGANRSFAAKYYLLRKKEGRIYADDDVPRLPFIYSSHPHYNEWMMRKNSSRALIDYINRNNRIVNILEVGCGNGWLSALIAKNTDTIVSGIDINAIELEQAKRVFYKVPSLNFSYGSLENEGQANKTFDLILFAASIQYFPSLKHIICKAIKQLEPGGEVHIMDSHLYKQHELAAARQRTNQYYDSIGFPGMKDQYHHHVFEDLKTFSYKILHHPNSWKNKMSIKKNPFYWIAIKNVNA